MRMCCGCNQRFNQRRLIRLQLSSNTQALIPVDKKQTGRSAWVCCDIDCIRKIHSHPKKLQRSLRKQPRMGTFLDTLYFWMQKRTHQMINTIQFDGAISFNTKRLTQTKFNEVYVIPYEILKQITPKTIDCDFISSNETSALLIHEHHLRQSTIRYIDVLINLKLDSFR